MKKIAIAIIAIMVVVLGAACLVGCDKAGDVVEDLIKEDIGVVDVQSIKYDNSKLTWSAVEGAKEYIVKIDDDENEKITTSTELTQLMKKDFKVTIKAKGKKEVGEAVTKEFHKLGAIEGLTISSEGELSWSLVEGADAYKILLNNKELEESVTETTFNNFVEGKNTVKVKPINSQDNSYFGLWSEMKSITIVPNPTEVKYDGQYITWRGNTLAEGYEVYINGTLYETVKDATRLIYDAKQTSFDLKIRSLGDHKETFDAKVPEEAKQILFLKPVSEFFVKNGAITWAEVEEAKGYQIEINGTVQSSILTEAAYSNIPEGKRVAIRVKPVSDVEDTFTDWSIVQEVFLLSKPTAQWNDALKLDGDAANSLYWDAVDGAAGYTVEITYPDKTTEEKTLSAKDKSFAHDYLEVGEYKLRIKANAEANTSTYDSAYSSPVTVVRLAAPEAATQDFIKSDKKDLANGVTVTFTKVSGAKEYKIFKDGVELEGSNTVTSVVKLTDIIPSTTTKQQDVNYSIQALGSFVSNSHGITATLDSLSKDNLKFKLTVLGMPNGMNMEGYKYSWNGTANASEYGVNVGGNVRVVNTPNVDLSVLEAGEHQVSICSAGNGADVLPSWYTAPLAITRLAAPYNIRIVTADQEEGRLEWEKIAKAKSYTVIVGKDSKPVDVNKLGNLNSMITEQGTVVSMKAVANYYNDLKTEYYMSSVDSETVQFIKLATVELPTPYVRNSNLVWNPPKNLDTDAYTPTYRIYDQTGRTYNGQENSTSFDFFGVEPGTYTFAIKAIGDGEKFINSAVSKAVNITKLAAPVVTAKDGKYEWKGIPGATGYKAIVDGVVQTDIKHDTASQTYSFAPHFTEIKKYHVEVIAVGDNVDIVDSDPAVIEQQTKQLSAPKFAFRYTGEAFDTNSDIEIRITEADPNASGYIYNVGYDSAIVDTKTAGDVYTYCPKRAGEYKLGVYAVGQKFGVIDGVTYYFLDSEITGNNQEKTILILDAPSNVEINRDNQVIFKPVFRATKYEIMILWDGAETGEIVSTKTLAYNLDVATHTSVQLKIRAVGNGKNVITSNWLTTEIYTF